MTLQAPLVKLIPCHNCGAEIYLGIDPITKRRIPLDPYFNNEPHNKYCKYKTSKYDNPNLEPMILDFLSHIPKPERKRRVLFAVGQARP